ncbi:hypothetical protein E2562_023436 [Oryza meyeriana var. granulata]|uniref:Uncharacterized protein n=1 Tax=Oryza meyeriana var. granulata TaxID=110450 RepID=A0A6G1FB41_9ORYZ|nr:hypothetical protein E2562_023436 [Oryza meyeriana var. granulata]
MVNPTTGWPFPGPVKPEDWGNKRKLHNAQNSALGIIDADVISTLIFLLKTSEKDIKEEAAWAISNAASGIVIPYHTIATFEGAGLWLRSS